MKTAKNLLKRKLVWALGVLIIVVMPAIVLVSRWGSSPTTTAIHIDSYAPAAQQKPTYKALKSPYFTTQVPSSWQVEAPVTTSGRLQISANASGTAHGLIGIVTAVLPGDGLPGVADYKLRTADPATYKLMEDANLPAGAIAFAAVDASSYTIFLTHGGRYASVTISGFMTVNETHRLVGVVMDAWQWQ